MPRPKRPQPVRTVPSSKRVAKPTFTTSDLNQERKSFPASQGLSTTSPDGNDQNRRKRIGPRASESRPQNTTDALPRKNENSTSEGSQRLRAKSSSSVNKKDTAEPKKVIGKRKRLDEVTHQSSESSAASDGSGTSTTRRLPTTMPITLSSQVLQPQSTPLAHSSMLGALQFKKRTRQPSLLQIAQSTQDVPSDVDDLDLQDFRPDDESTPLIKSLTQIAAESPSRDSSRSKKRQTLASAIHVRASQPRANGSSSPSNRSLRSDDSFDLPRDDEGELPEPTLPPLRHTQTQSPGLTSSRLVTSQNNSTPAKSITEKSLHGASGAGRRPILHSSPEHLTLLSSPQSNAKISQPATTRSKPPVPPTPLTTARLQNLLPRRRARLKPSNTYDVPSSSEVELDATNLGEDEDELSFHAASKMRRKKAIPDAKSKRGLSKGGKPQHGLALKGRQTPKTYSKKKPAETLDGSDDDQDDFGDTSVELDDSTGKMKPILDSKAKAEMKRLADKFKEIDEYTMEFEEMTGSSSQMKDAR